MISPVASDACVNKVHQTARVPLVAGGWRLALAPGGVGDATTNTRGGALRVYLQAIGHNDKREARC
jgi:hypothetical protein